MFLALFTGCSDDDDQQRDETNMKQGWKLASLSVNDSPVDISGYALPELMYYSEQSLCYFATPVDNNGTWEYNDERTSWSYDYGNNLLNIAAHLPVTYYVDAITVDRFVLRYYVFNSTGGVDKYVKEYQSAAVVIEDLKLRLSF